jgi:hypothetical protein
MSYPLLDAHRSLEVAVASLGAMASNGKGRVAYRQVNRALRHLRLILSPAPTVAPVVSQPKLLLASVARANGYTSPKRPRPKRMKSEPASGVRNVRPSVPPEEPTVAVASCWDPAPLDEQLEASRCRAFLLEIVRRAVYDWVLYRQHSQLDMKEIAAHAYTWLFDEDEDHPWWKQRVQEGRTFTALISICDVLDLDPKVVRARAKSMDVRTILAAGRPPEVRRRRANEESDYQEHGVSGEIDVSGHGDDSGSSFYENHFAVATMTSVM